MRITQLLLGLFLVLLWPMPARSQQVLDRPIMDLERAGIVRTHLTLPDGRMLIGGTFSKVDGLARSGLARLNIDGTLDSTWQMDVVGEVQDLEARGDGAIYVAGSFTRIAGQERIGIALIWPGTATLDSWTFPTIYQSVHDVAALANGDLLLTRERDFIRYESATGNHVTGFANWQGSNYSNSPHTLVASADRQRVLIAGSRGVGLYSQNGTTIWYRDDLGVIDDVNFGPGNSACVATAISHSAGSHESRLRKILADGTLSSDWSALVPGTVSHLSSNETGEIWVPYWNWHQVAYSSYPTHPGFPIGFSGGVMKFAADGTLLSGAEVNSGRPGDIAFLANGDVYVFGALQTTDHALTPGAARMSSQLQIVDDAPRFTRPSNHVWAFAHSSDGRTLVAGDFIRVNGQERRFMFALDRDYELLPDAWALDAAPTVMHVDSLGQCYLGGSLPLFEGSASTLHRLTDCRGLDDAYRLVLGHPVTALTSTSTHLVVASTVPDADSGMNSLLVGYKMSGSGAIQPAWATLMSSANRIHALAAIDNTVFAGGSTVSRIPDSSTGAIDPNWVVPRRPNPIFGMTALRRGELVVSGMERDDVSLARISAADGSMVPDWSPPEEQAEYYSFIPDYGATMLQPDGTILAAPLGGWSSAISVFRVRVDRPTTRFDEDFDASISGGHVRQMETLSDGSVLMVGTFLGFMGQSRPGIARFGGTRSGFFVDDFE
jgi:hypothetical protein